MKLPLSLYASVACTALILSSVAVPAAHAGMTDAENANRGSSSASSSRSSGNSNSPNAGGGQSGTSASRSSPNNNGSTGPSMGGSGSSGSSSGSNDRGGQGMGSTGSNRNGTSTGNNGAGISVNGSGERMSPAAAQAAAKADISAVKSLKASAGLNDQLRNQLNAINGMGYAKSMATNSNFAGALNAAGGAMPKSDIDKQVDTIRNSIKNTPSLGAFTESPAKNVTTGPTTGGMSPDERQARSERIAGGYANAMNLNSSASKAEAEAASYAKAAEQKMAALKAYEAANPLSSKYANVTAAQFAAFTPAQWAEVNADNARIAAKKAELDKATTPLKAEINALEEKAYALTKKSGEMKYEAGISAAAAKAESLGLNVDPASYQSPAAYAEAQRKANAVTQATNMQHNFEYASKPEATIVSTNAGTPVTKENTDKGVAVAESNAATTPLKTTPDTKPVVDINDFIQSDSHTLKPCPTKANPMAKCP